jgi:DNA-binding NarL/FixJ family response regulator
MSLVNIVIVEDDARYRQGLETLFSHSPGFALAGCFGSADAALLAAAAGAIAGWDVMFLDIDLPGTSGIEATRRLKRMRPELAIVMLTVFEEPATMLQAICAGADGYALKKSSARQLLEQAKLAAEGGAPLTAPVARSILELVRTLGGDTAAATAGAAPTRLALSERERQVLRELVDGKGYRQIGDALGVHIDTVRSHVRHLYKKLQVHTAAEAVARAVREQLV